MATIFCEGCCKSVDVIPSRHRRFCTHACWAKWKLNRTARGEVVSTPTSEIPCAHCSRPFRPIPAQVRAGYGKFCSRVCARTAHRGQEHAPHYANRSSSERMEWYNSHGWIGVRKRMCSRPCQRCDAQDGRREVHHKVDPFLTRSVDLLLDEDNLEVLCATCHRREHKPGRRANCKRCNTEFTVTSGHKVYCSVECDYAARAAGRLPERPCAVCQAPFQPREAHIMCCSRACGAKRTAEIKLARRVQLACARCQTPFSVAPSRAKQYGEHPCCSQECSLALKRQVARAHGPSAS